MPAYKSVDLPLTEGGPPPIDHSIFGHVTEEVTTGGESGFPLFGISGSASPPFPFSETHVEYPSTTHSIIVDPVADPAGSFDFPAHTPFTVEAWIKSGQGPIVSLTQGAGANGGYELEVNSGVPRFRRISLFAPWCTGIFLVPGIYGDWHWLIATFDGTDLRLYQDGVLTATEPDPNTIPALATQNLHLGKQVTGIGTSWYVGHMAHVTVWNGVHVPSFASGPINLSPISYRAASD